jgi:hypothetical protein
VLAAPALLTDYQVDDWLQHLKLEEQTSALGVEMSPSEMFEFVDGDPVRTRHLMEIGFLPWWTREEIKLSFWRPLTVLTHVLDHKFWPDSFFMMHLHSLAWYVAAVVMAGAFYRKLLAPLWAAGLAALLFAIDDAHAMPAGWIANRNACIALFFGLLTLWAHVKWREDNRSEWLTLSVFSLVIALLAKEEGLAACAYLFAYAVFLDPGRLMTRVISMLPYAGTVVGWRLIYRALGHGITGAEVYADPLLSPGDFVLKLLHRAPVLFLGQWGLPPSDIHIVLPAGGQWLLWLGGLVLFVILAITFAPMFRYDARLRFWALGMGLSLIPACAAFPTDRLLMWPGIGAFGLLAQYLFARSERREVWSHAGFARVVAPLVTFLLVTVHIALAPLLMPVRIFAWDMLGDAMRESIEMAPLPENIEDRTLVIANAPNVFFTSYFLVIRDALGLPVPNRIRTLSANCPLPEPHDISRIDENTLSVRPKSGFRWYLVRDDDHPLGLGETVDLGDMTVEVELLSREGWPAEVQYRFEDSIDNPRYVWIVYKANLNQFVPFLPPPVGQTYTLNPYL